MKSLTKKAIALTSAFAVCGTFAVCAATMAITDTGISINTETKEVTVPYEATGAAEATILAWKPATENDTPSSTNIKFIDQETADDSVTFKVASLDDLKGLQIDMGGTDVSQKDTATLYGIDFVNGETTTTSYLAGGATFTAPATDPTKAEDAENTYTFAGWSTDGTAATIVDLKTAPVKVNGNVTYTAVFTATPKQSTTVDATVTVNSGIDGDPYGIANGKIVRVSGNDITATSVVKVKVGEDVYTAKNYTATDGSTVAIVGIVSETAPTIDNVTVETGTPEAMVFGDSTADEAVDTDDSLIIELSYLNYYDPDEEITFELPTELADCIAWDTTGDGIIDTDDSLFIELGYMNFYDPDEDVTFTLPTMPIYDIK